MSLIAEPCNEQISRPDLMASQFSKIRQRDERRIGILEAS
jgi:hypothetical protein